MATSLVGEQHEIEFWEARGYFPIEIIRLCVTSKMDQGKLLSSRISPSGPKNLGEAESELTLWVRLSEK